VKASETWTLIVDTVVGIWDSFKIWLSESTTAMVNSVVNSFQWLYDHNYYFQALVDFINEKWEMLKTFTTEAWNTLTSTVSNIWTGLVDTVSSITTTIKDTVVNIFNTATEPVRAAWTTIKTVITDTWTELKDTASTWASNMMDMFIEGIKSKIDFLKDTMNDVGEAIADFLGFHSPTKEGPCSDSDKWAGNFMTMFADGIHANKSLVTSAANGVASSIRGTFDSAMSYAKSMASKISSLSSSFGGSSGGGGGSSSRSSRHSSTQEWARNNRDEIERIKKDLGVDHIDIQEARDRSESSSRSRSSRSRSKSSGSIRSRVSKSISKAVSSVRKKFKFHTGGFVNPKTQEMNATLKMGEFVLSRGHIDFIKKNSGRGASIDYDRLAEAVNDKSNKGINQTVNIYSPKELNPSEIARKNKIALQKLAMGL
jgi:uncharacterized membrane protein YgcG